MSGTGVSRVVAGTSKIDVELSSFETNSVISDFSVVSASVRAGILPRVVDGAVFSVVFPAWIASFSGASEESTK